MHGFLIAEHQAALFQQLADHRVRILEEFPRHRRDFGLKITVQSDSVNYGQALLLPYGEVIHTIGRCGMHNAGTVLGADKIGGDNAERVPALHLEVVKRSLVTPADQFATLYVLDDAVIFIGKVGLHPLDGCVNAAVHLYAGPAKAPFVYAQCAQLLAHVVVVGLLAAVL